MTIEWERTKMKGEYYVGRTASRFEARIAMSTNAGKYVWTVCHTDFRFVVIGGEVDTVEEGKRQADIWLSENAKV